MVVLATGACVTAGGPVMAALPGEPEPGPGYVPPPIPLQPGAQGDVWAVAVADFPSGTLRGVLWDAKFSYGRQVFGRGPASLDLVCPASMANMRVLGEPTNNRDQAGRVLRKVSPLALELLVTLNGKVTDRYVVRGQVSHGGGKIRVTGHTLDKLFDERVLGRAIRKNSITNGSFEQGLAGWTLHGGVTATVHTGGPSGARFVKLKGPPGSYISRATRMTRPTAQEGRQKVAGSALVRVPDGDWGDYSLVSMHVRQGAKVYWPSEYRDASNGLFDPDWPRGRWLADEVVAFGWLPPAPFDATVEIRLHPVDETEEVWVDQAAVFRRASTSTAFEADLCRAVEQVIRTEQLGEGKSSWNAGVIRGAQTGVEELTTWWHDDVISMPEAIESVVGREDGPDVWPDGPTRRFHIARRRGAKRYDLKLNFWDVLGSAGWSQDASEQKSAIHGLSSASSAFGGAREGVVGEVEGGQVIEVTMTGPAGFNPNQLRAWLRAQLRRRRLPQSTARLVLPWQVGRRIAVGDQVQVALVDGAAVMAGWYQVTAWECDPARRLVFVDVGTDPGGN